MRYLMIALLLLTGSSAFAQINYVSNGDFELFSKCPGSSVDQIILATGWTPLDTITKHTDGSGNHNCSADYCNECAPANANWSAIPLNILGYQYPHSEKGMAAIYMYNDFDTSQTHVYYLRDYIQSKLVKKLTAGKRYCVSFYVVLTEAADWAIKEIGAYFDNGSIDATPFCGLPQTQCTPQVVNSGSVLSDTANWVKIEGSFVANGKEQFITIGNFKDNTHTTAVSMPRNKWNGLRGTYYLVDDVSVIESTTVADAGPDKHVGKGDSIYIGRPKEVGLECTWSVLGNPTVIGTGAGIWVKPAAATSYVVTQTLCGNITKDTVRVEVWAAGVNSINGQSQQYTLLPNPNDGRMQLLQAVTDKQPVSIKVYNVVGAVVHSSTRMFEGNTTMLNLSSIAPGVYYMTLQDSAGATFTLKFVKK